MTSSKEVVQQITDRFYSDAAGFSTAFTKIFYEQDGTKQKLYPKQVEFLNLIKPEEKIIMVVKSRQVGMSTAIQARAVHRAYFGKVPEILITSAGMNQAQRVLKKIKQAFVSMPEFMQTEFEKDTETQIKLPNGTIIYSLPANADTCRGFTGEVLMDEMGILNRKDGNELWEALFPCTAKGYQITGVSTPKGKDCIFHDLINPLVSPETGLPSGPSADKVIKVYWWDVPHIAAVIEDFRRGMHPKQFRQEFECEFVDDAESSFFPYDFMLGYVVDQRAEPVEIIDPSFIEKMSDTRTPDFLKTILKEKYPNGVYMGWDVAVADDGSICTVFGVTEDDVWELISFKKFAKNTDVTVQVDYVVKMALVFNAKKLTFDATGGLGLATHGLLKLTDVRNIINPFKFSNTSKAQEYSELRSKMEKEGFRIPKIDECIKEFTQLGHNPVTGRIAAIGHHRTHHDDWPSSFLCAYAGRKKKITPSGISLL